MKSLFDSQRMKLADSVRVTAASLKEYGQRYPDWALAYSGGKDSTAAVTLTAYLIESGIVPRPRSLTVLYADTRMELPPLQISATGILQCLARKGITARVVLPELDDRFFVYMFGRGVPPPKNRFRWCTPQLKIEPMLRALTGLRDLAGQKLLMLTGVRLGESAARDARIAVSCGKDGSECGQGWFQEATPEAIADTLAPLLHWRVCHVWEWLTEHAPRVGFPTAMLIADSYGGKTDMESLIEANARTGCVGCNLASRDTALDRVLTLPQWAYLEPLKRLRPLYGELKEFRHRLQKNGERKKDGTLSANPMRKGPLTMDARCFGLGKVLKVQADINQAAREHGRPEVSLINAQELARIVQLQEANTWPDGWTGDEPIGDEDLPEVFPDGTIQQLLFDLRN